MKTGLITAVLIGIVGGWMGHSIWLQLTSRQLDNQTGSIPRPTNTMESTTIGPFGLQKGMTLNQMGVGAAAVAPGKYKVTHVPKPHSAFESYILQVGPKTGLCWIKALGKNFTTSVYGIEVRGQFDDMKAKLEQTYGTFELTDSLLPGSIWNEPKDWMMALIKKERFLLAVWNRESKAKLPVDIKQVGLTVSPQGDNNAYIAVEYSFSNETECEKEIGKKEDSVL